MMLINCLKVLVHKYKLQLVVRHITCIYGLSKLNWFKVLMICRTQGVWLYIKLIMVFDTDYNIGILWRRHERQCHVAIRNIITKKERHKTYNAVSVHMDATFQLTTTKTYVLPVVSVHTQNPSCPCLSHTHCYYYVNEEDMSSTESVLCLHGTTES